MACPGHAVLGTVIPKTLRTTNLQSITTKCKQRLSLGRSLGRPCPRRHALGMLSLAGSVPGPCEQRTYTRKQSPNILQQGWELSQQWSSGDVRQLRVCNQKGKRVCNLMLLDRARAARPCARLRAWGLIIRLVSRWYYVAVISCIRTVCLAPSCTIRPWTGLGRILEPCLGNHRKALVSSVHLCLFNVRAFLGKPVKITFLRKKGCKLMDQI